MVATHRERKKLQTRKALVESAHQLFAQKGYDATTIAEIASGANCAPRTFFQYFTSKEDLLLVGIDEFWNGLADALAARPKGVTTLESTHQWMITATKGFMHDDQPFMKVLEQEVGNTHISAQARTQLYSITRMKDILIPELAKDLDVKSGAAEPRLIAIATAAMLDAYHSDADLAKMKPLVFIEETFRILEAAMKAVHSAAPTISVNNKVRKEMT
jgi:AcrR family transcriptional regulator